MLKWLNKIDQWHSRNVLLYSIAAAILIAAWMQYIQHGWINPDSIIYLEQGRLIALGDWHGAYQVFVWPFYGACIGLLHAATGFGIQASAQVLNMLFFAIATGAYLKIIQLAGGGPRTMLAGAMLLFGNTYIVGDVLEMLMRDEGFWAFYLLGIFFFIRYALTANLRDALAWQLSMGVATLFRIEGLIFLLLLPISLCFLPLTNTQSKLKALLSNYAFLMIGAMVIVGILVSHPEMSMQQFGRLREVFSLNLYQEFTKILTERAGIMSQQVLGEYLEEYATIGLLLTFAYVVMMKTITTTGLVGSSLIALNHFKNNALNKKILSNPSNINSTAKRILIVTACIALLTMVLTIIKVFVLSSRYVVPLAWVMLILASFYFVQLSSNKKSQKLVLVMCLVLILGLVKNVLPKREGHAYMQDAAAWAKQQHIPTNTVFCNDTRMRYYMRQPFSGTWADNTEVLKQAIASGNIQQYDVLMLTESAKQRDTNAQIAAQLQYFAEVKRFNSFKAKNAIVIYRKIAN